MKIVQKLNIPSTYFYHKIIDSVLYDIRKQTGTDVTEEQLDGFSYVKKFNNTTSAKLLITKLVPNEAYHYETQSTQTKFLVSYDIKAIGDHETELTYEEHVEAKSWMRQVNNMVVGWIMGWMRRRDFRKMLTQIEESY
ncbi:DUF3284 domain-containing protein [Lapidilactobacillus salsurivasis]